MPAANLEQLRKQAKDLLKAHRAGMPQALDRVAATHPGPRGPLKLADTQLVIAREHGFPSWPRLRAYVDRITRHGTELRHPFEDDIAYYADRADGLLASAIDGTEPAVARFGATPPTTRAAREIVARDHGFAGWAALRDHVTGLPTSGEPFYRAFRAIRAHDLDRLDHLLGQFPELVTATGTNGNDLLGLAAATCDERLVALLIDNGAPVNRGNVHGWTALHQAAYLGLPHLARVLLDAGARRDLPARGEGGTPMIVALFWGHRAVAAQVAGPPRNLRAAAGLDDVAMIDSRLASGEAGAHRGFYRPHSGFPPWRPKDDPAEVLDEALSWAARNGSTNAIEALAAHGADLDADVYRGTALAWAAATGQTAAITTLLRLGADPNRRGTFGGPQHGANITALHLAAESGHLPAIEALLAGGADRTAREANYDATPAGWADHNGHADARALLET